MKTTWKRVIHILKTLPRGIVPVKVKTLPATKDNKVDVSRLTKADKMWLAELVKDETPYETRIALIRNA